jgi:uncharacterized protein YbaR (Trm112 family)
MALDPKLLEILACPEDHGPLLYFAADEILYNPRLRRKYRIEDGIPLMLLEDCISVDAAEHEATLARAKQQDITLNFSQGHRAR